MAYCLEITSKWLEHDSSPKQKQGTIGFTTRFAVINEFNQGLRFVHNPTKSTKRRPLQNRLKITSKWLENFLWANGPFAASGHVVQNPPCWRASHAPGHPKQRKCKFVLMKSLSSGCPSGQLALQHGGFCTM